MCASRAQAGIIVMPLAVLFLHPPPFYFFGSWSIRPRVSCFRSLSVSTETAVVPKGYPGLTLVGSRHSDQNRAHVGQIADPQLMMP